jgi:tyrosine decarboxylase / aspartate 1-decarboxylase
MGAVKEVASFGKSKSLEGRAGMAVPPTPFPEVGRPEDVVWNDVHTKLEKNVDPQKNWVTYGVEAHPFAKKVFGIPAAIDTYAVEFYRDLYPGIFEMGQEAVRMIGSLLHASNPAGFITTGGTEANLMAMRLARNLGKKAKPEVIVPLSRHYSFDLAAELFGLTLRVVDVDGCYRADVDGLRDLVSENTVALVCSTPNANVGAIDPVEKFAHIAEEHGLYFHVDAAIGGFLLPFMSRLGRQIPPFDFRVPAVMSMTVDPHKLGLCPRPSGGFILRDMSLLEAGVELDNVVIDTLTASGRPGSATAAVWALIKHLGMEGYTEIVRHQLNLVDMLVDGVQSINGLRLVLAPETNIVCVTSDDVDISEVSTALLQKGYMIPLNPLPPFRGKHLRLYVHPLKETMSVEMVLRDLQEIMGRLAIQR